MEGTQNVLWIVQQAMAELGLPQPREVAASQDELVRQFLALLNRCGYELVQGYPWEQLDKQWILETELGKDEYTLPSALRSYSLSLRNPLCISCSSCGNLARAR